MRCLEFYSGIGGFAVAAGELGWAIQRAYDINQNSARVYRHNFKHRHDVVSVESLCVSELASLSADFWWMSPPCQPFTIRGQRRGLQDDRSIGFLRTLDFIGEVQPPMLCLENVPGFGESEAADRLRAVLDASNYQWRECELCPSDFGVPNRRRRFYVLASRQRMPAEPDVEAMDVSLQDLVDDLVDSRDESLFVGSEIQLDYAKSIHVVGVCESNAVTSCFTSAYGKSPIRSGSYLEVGERLRRFSPTEILRLLGFPIWYQLPDDLTNRQAWKLVGNSLSIAVVRSVLRAFESNGGEFPSVNER